MNKHQSLLLYGILVVVSGLLMIALRLESIEAIKYSIISCFLASAAFALYTAYLSKDYQVRLVYHEFHALAMIGYSITLLLFFTTIDRFLCITTFYLLFYFFAEIIFCNRLFNLNLKISPQVLFARLAFGFFVGIGTVVIISHPVFTPEMEMIGFGVLMIMVGINTLFYRPVIKLLEFDSVKPI